MNGSLVVAVGELVVDWIAKERSTGFIESSTFVKSLGGNASNVAIGLARLGTSSRILARVGSDVHGRYLLKVLNDEGVDTDFVCVDNSSPTAQCYVFTSVHDDNTFLNWPPNNAASKLSLDDIHDGQLEGAKCVHATGISLTSEPRKTAVLHVLEKALKRDMVISFDAGFPTGAGEEARQAVETAIKKAHIVKVNLSELFFWCKTFGLNVSDKDREFFSLYEKPPSTGQEAVASSSQNSVTRERIEELASSLFDQIRPVLLVVTLAERGSLVLSSKAKSWRRSIMVDYVAGVGAGDAFVAGFIHALLATGKNNPKSLAELSEDDLAVANQFASIVGAMATTHISAYEGLPTRDEVERILEQN
ncbi:MAG: hypothetical protein K2Z81_01015 [Cyanobacteria bacterium]|nr:hypothetical protein [Cyanobacteriota bacterium]